MTTFKKVIRQFFIDNDGKNKIITSATTKRITIYLHLQSDKRKRKIGTITLSTKTMEIKRNRGEHLFRKGTAYGFNEYVLRQTKLADKIRLSDEHDNWKIPIEHILKNGKYLHFQQQGFERQLFLSLDELEQFKIDRNSPTRF